jgi:hypothetical protein
MSDTQEAAQGGRRDPRIVDEHHIAGAHAEDEIEAIDDRGRRWHQVRPQPRRRSDLMGFNSAWWIGAGLARRDPPARLPVPMGGVVT